MVWAPHEVTVPVGEVALTAGLLFPTHPQMYESNYPETLHKLFVVNPPKVGAAVDCCCV